MEISVTPAQLQIPDVQSMGTAFLLMGGNAEFKDDHTEYALSPSGENYFTQGYYEVCKENGLTIDKGNFYTVQPQSILDNLVQVSFPDSKDSEGVRRVWSEYAPFHWLLDDGTVLFACVHVLLGKTCGNGLSDDERLIWDDYFGGLLVKSEGELLIPRLDDETP